MSEPALSSDQPVTPPRPAGRRAGRTVVTVVVFAMAGMWIWVFAYHLSGNWRDETPGRLSDVTYGLGAEGVCIDAVRELSRLPAAQSAASAGERADVVDASNDVLAQMLAELGELPPLDADDQRRVDEWLGDWQTFLDDRADYVERLRSDPDARFYVTQSDRDRRQVTVAIDRFAGLNGMPSCATPSDLA